MIAVAEPQPARRRYPDEPEALVRASVEPEHGRWAVVLDIVFADGALRHRIADYPTQRRAEVAARFMRAAAERRPGGTQP